MEMLARDGDLPVAELVEAPAADRGMQILEYVVAGLAMFAAIVLTFLR